MAWGSMVGQGEGGVSQMHSVVLLSWVTWCWPAAGRLMQAAACWELMLLRQAELCLVHCTSRLSRQHSCHKACKYGITPGR
jgi:hypothetical protein